MNYPKIYSISTVGILKHYIHDYLLHPIRTDIIGPNGVGKSIIADLLQLMFVYDTENIKFGTDSLKNDQRSINTLPYQTSTAYCFLNVELSAGKFIIIGIAISAVKGTRIVPFVITKSAEIDTMPIDQLTLDEDEVIFSRDLLANKTIPVLQDLTRNLLKKGLYTNVFRTKDEVNRYYKFLFVKEVLPINLAIDKNLKAFAKVIQSFSKAKTLDLSKDKISKSLQEFLFEESDKEILDHYALQQESLDKILREYDTLNKYIKVLTDKQNKLSSLKEMELSYATAHKNYRRREIVQLADHLKMLKESGDQAREALRLFGDEVEILKGKLERFPEIEDFLEKRMVLAKNNLDNYGLYLDYQKTIDELNQGIDAMELNNLPVFNEDWRTACSSIMVKNHSASEFIDGLIYVNRYLTKYPNPNDIKNAWELQNRLLQQVSNALNSEREKLEKTYSLLKNQTEKSLFAWCANQNIPWSDDQKDLLLHFFSDPISKPDDPLINSRYLHPERLFLNQAVDMDREENGFWLNIGSLSEFIQYRPEQRLEMENNGGVPLAFILEKLSQDILNVDQKLAELAKINKGQLFDTEILDLEVDLSLINYDVVEKLESKMSYLVQWQEKLQDLKILRKMANEDLLLTKIDLPLNLEKFGSGPPRAILRVIVDQFHKRQLRLTKAKAQLTITLNTTQNKIDEINKDFEKQTINLQLGNDELMEMSKKYFAEFAENVDLDLVIEGSIDQLKQDYEDTYQKYRDNYRTIIIQYSENGNENPTGTANELDRNTYSFTVLEQALLGMKILSTDKIGDALNDANRNRLSIADGIRDNMLKVFENTLKRYRSYETQIQSLNDFFLGRIISNRFYFNLEFDAHPVLKIEFLEQLSSELRTAAREGEIQFDQSIDSFIETFFQKLTKMNERIPIAKLLNPKSYFKINMSLTDENKKEIPGSTGESYSAIALLGIARLSIVQKVPRKGLRFIILEEIGSLDKSNFNTFPEIAKEFDYQIITMAPHPFSAGLSDEWYAHHLIKGKGDKNINFFPSASYFKTKRNRTDLNVYLKKVSA